MSRQKKLDSETMGLRCARLSCGIEAVASMQFKNDIAEVHIIDLAEAVAGIPQKLTLQQKIDKVASPLNLTNCNPTLYIASSPTRLTRV